MLLLGAMVHSHLCAALCATGTYSCCDKKPACCKQIQNSCCDKSNEEKNCNDCQKEHLTFFNTIGQYHFIYVIDMKIIQSNIVALISKTILHSEMKHSILFAHTGFHPPPQCAIGLAAIPPPLAPPWRYVRPAC